MQVSDPDIGLRALRADARSRRLYALLLLLPMVPARLQAGDALSRRESQSVYVFLIHVFVKITDLIDLT